LSSIEEAFEGESKAFIPFTVAGYPDIDRSQEIIQTLVDEGADIIELGIPFSDPMADGPTIKQADQEAIESGAGVSQVLQLASEFKDTPIVLLSYLNSIHSYGYERFFRDAEDAGVDGLIVPDMPPEEFEEEMDDIETEVKNIFLVSQNTPEERVRKIGEMTEGFAYLVSVKGTTGARKNFCSKAQQLVENTEMLDVPRCIGFGISSPEHAQEAVEAGADGVIMGSAILDAYNEGGLEKTRELAAEITEAVSGNPGE